MSTENRGRRERANMSFPDRLRAYRLQKKERLEGMSRGQRIRRRLLQALVILAVVVLAIGLALRSWIRVPEVPKPGPAPTPGDGSQVNEIQGPDIAQSGRKEGVYTFLVVGRDTAGGGNTDTMMLVTYDTVNKTLHGMSLPRDTMVNVSTNNKKLNAVYNYNRGKDKATQVERGMTALKSQVAKLTGILPDYYVMLEWEAVGELVDALGGVYFDVPFNMDYDDPTPGQDLHIHQKAGYRKLTGDDAMQVIRHRKNNDGSHSGGDVARLKVQQDFLMAVAQECLQPKTLLKAPALAKIFMENVTTDLTLGNLLAFAELAAGMDAERDVSFVTMPYVGYERNGSYVLPVQDELLEIVNANFNPYTKEIRASDLEILYRNSDGSLSVTRGTLADSSLAKPRYSSSSSRPSKPEQDEDKDEPEITVPVEPEPPDDTTLPPDSGASGPDSSSSVQPGDSSTEPGGDEMPPSEEVPGDGGDGSGTTEPSGATDDPANSTDEPVDFTDDGTIPDDPVPGDGEPSAGGETGGSEFPDWLLPAA